MLRLIRELKPSYVVGENVTGLLSMEDGGTFEQICVDLENEGYTVESFVIPAAGVGAWHRRDRVWIVGYSCDSGDRQPRASVSANGEGINPKEQKGRRQHTKQPYESNYDGNATASDDPRSQRNGRCREDQGRCNSEGHNRSSSGARNRGQTIPGVRRVGDGIPNWMDGHPEPTTTLGKGRAERLKQLGNAVVPQVVYEIFKAIEAHEAHQV